MTGIRFQLSPRTARMAHPLPDGFMAMLFVIAAFVPMLPGRDELLFTLGMEGGFLLMQGTLIDIATRLKKRLPVPVALLLVGGLTLLMGYPMQVLRIGWDRGLYVFLPLLLSLAERGAVLWRMPGRTQTEKMAARALVSNRITTGLGLLFLAAVAMILSIVRRDFDLSETAVYLAGALYFGIAAFDSYRVRGRRFAEAPRVLFGFDPIRIGYLEPL